MLAKSGWFWSFDCHMCGISQEERGQESDGKSISTSTRHLTRNQTLLRRRKAHCQGWELCKWGGTHRCPRWEQRGHGNGGAAGMQDAVTPQHTGLWVGILTSPMLSCEGLEHPGRQVIRPDYTTAAQAEGLSIYGCCCCYIVQVGLQYLPKDLSSLTWL